MKLNGLIQKNDLIKLNKVLGQSFPAHNDLAAIKKVKERFAKLNYEQRVSIEYGDATEKQSRYQQILTAMLQDQWNWIKNKKHVRVIDDDNAVESTRVAEEATMAAQYFNA